MTKGQSIALPEPISHTFNRQGPLAHPQKHLPRAVSLGSSPREGRRLGRPRNSQGIEGKRRLYC